MAADGSTPFGKLEFAKGVFQGSIGPLREALAGAKVEMVVDGVVEAELAPDAGDGEDGLLFNWLVPSRYYDGQPHTFEARIAGGDAAQSRRVSGYVLPDKSKPDIRAEVRVTDAGGLNGYAYNSKWLRRKLELEFWVDGRCREVVRCDRDPPDFAPDDARESSGFALAPSAELTSWITRPVRIVVSELGEQINPDPWILQDVFRLESVSPAEELVAVVVRPNLYRETPLEVRFDGEIVSDYSTRLFSGMVHLIVPAPAADDDRPVHQLSVRIAGSGKDIPGSPVDCTWVPATNLVRNGVFEAWEGDRPADWQLGAPAGVVARPSVQAGSARYAIAFSGAAEGDGAIPLLRQAIDLRKAPADVLELRVRARGVGEAVISLEPPQGAEGDPSELVVKLSPQWGDQIGRIAIPLSWERRSPAALALRLRPVGDVGGEIDVELGSVQAGAPGFAPIDEGAQEASDPSSADEEAGPESWSAVLNGDFRSWNGGFEFRVLAGAHELADGWFANSRKDSPGASLHLAQLRLPSDRGQPPQTIYGLQLEGSIESEPFALETVLDRELLAARKLGGLTVLAGQARRPVGVTSPAPSRVSRIYIAARLASGQAADDVLAVIARNMVLSPDLARRAFPLSGAQARAVQQAARAIGPEDQLLLVFEFLGKTLDGVIAEVSLGREAVAEATRGELSGPRRRTGYVALEDYNVVSQLGRLKGFEDWISPAARSAAAAAAGEAAPVKWNWLPQAASVDIVIPVYNALKEVTDCLASIERSTSLPHRVVIVNDKSDLHTSQFLSQYAADRRWVELIENPSNLGYTRSSNAGLTSSRAEWVVLLNSDTVVSEGWLEGLLECAASDPDVAMVGPLSNAASWQSVPQVKDPRGGWMVNRLPDEMSVDAFAHLVRDSSERAFPQVPLLNGFCTLMRRSAIAAVGFLDEKAFPVGYGEENDLCIRIAKAGYTLRLADHVYVHHVKSASFGGARGDLAKQGTAACAAKHPDVKLDELTGVMGECLPLIRLRRVLQDKLGLGNKKELS